MKFIISGFELSQRERISGLGKTKEIKRMWEVERRRIEMRKIKRTILQ